MFGFRKNSVSRLQIGQDILNALASTYQTIEELVDDSGTNVPEETAALIYVIGWFAVQTSDLDANSKHILSVTLIDSVRQQYLNHVSGMSLANFLQSRMVAYRDAINSVEAKQAPLAIAFRFLRYVSLDPRENPAAMSGVALSASGSLEAIAEYVNGLSRDYNIV